jgi:hypothetical protein
MGARSDRRKARERTAAGYVCLRISAIEIVNESFTFLV